MICDKSMRSVNEIENESISQIPEKSTIKFKVHNLNTQQILIGLKRYLYIFGKMPYAKQQF